MYVEITKLRGPAHICPFRDKFTDHYRVYRFCTLAPISVFYVDIYSSSLRLLKIDLLVSLLPAIHRQYSIFISVVFAVTLALRFQIP